MVWGVDSGKVKEDILSPLGLTCYGGGTKNGEMSYHIYNDDKSFDVELTLSELKDIEYIYNKFKRKDKLQKLNSYDSRRYEK